MVNHKHEDNIEIIMCTSMFNLGQNGKIKCNAIPLGSSATILR